MSLRIPPYQPLPAPGKGTEVFQLPIAALHPTQMCIGLAEVRNRQVDFSQESREQRLSYLRTKPIPLVCLDGREHWMVDRHHRLRGLIEIDPRAEAFGYVVLQLAGLDRHGVLEELHSRGWLYLYDGRGLGPLPPSALPDSLTGLQDDPYRSLVWKLKKEKVIEAAPGVAYEDEHVRMVCDWVEHIPREISECFGVRFEAEGKVVAFSGDTAPCASMEKLAAGADPRLDAHLARVREQTSAAFGDSSSGGAHCAQWPNAMAAGSAGCGRSKLNSSGFRTVPHPRSHRRHPAEA